MAHTIQPYAEAQPYYADGHVIEKTGSMAVTNLPAAVTGNAFNADNELTAFNGTALAYDPMAT